MILKTGVLQHEMQDLSINLNKKRSSAEVDANAVYAYNGNMDKNRNFKNINFRINHKYFIFKKTSIIYFL